MKVELSTWYGRMPKADLDAPVIGQFHTVGSLSESVGIQPWKSIDVDDIFDKVRRTIILSERELYTPIPNYGMVNFHTLVSSPYHNNVKMWGRSKGGCTTESLAICETTGAVLCISPNHGTNVQTLTTLQRLKPYSPIYYWTAATIARSTVKSPFACLKQNDFMKVPAEDRNSCLKIVRYLSGVIEWKLRGYSQPMLYISGKRRLAIRDLKNLCDIMIGADKLRVEYTEDAASIR